VASTPAACRRYLKVQDYPRGCAVSPSRSSRGQWHDHRDHRDRRGRFRARQAYRTSPAASVIYDGRNGYSLFDSNWPPGMKHQASLFSIHRPVRKTTFWSSPVTTPLVTCTSHCGATATGKCPRSFRWRAPPASNDIPGAVPAADPPGRADAAHPAEDGRRPDRALPGRTPPPDHPRGPGWTLMTISRSRRRPILRSGLTTAASRPPPVGWRSAASPSPNANHRSGWCHRSFRRRLPR
jgi:hypothetical protein